MIGNHEIMTVNTEEYFNTLFESTILDNLLIYPSPDQGPCPVWNPEIEDNSWFQNYAFDMWRPGEYRYHLVCLDFSSRMNRSGYLGGGADLHVFDGGTYPWANCHLTNYLRYNQLDDDHILIFSHHPPTKLSLGDLYSFSPMEYDQIIPTWIDHYQNDIGYWFAGHYHRGEIYNVRDYIFRTLCVGIETDAVMESWTKLRLVRIKTPSGDGGGDGDGGNGGCPHLYIWDGSQFIYENSILPASMIDTLYRTDYYNIEQSLEPKSGEYVLQIRESGDSRVYLDKAKLIIIDHPDDLHAKIDRDGYLIFYKDSDSKVPISCVDNHGNDLLQLVKSKDTTYCVLQDGDS